MKGANSVLYLAIAVPLATVVASFATLAMTLQHPESELPEQYHWEGLQLDRDFSRGERAARLGVHADIDGLDRGGQCSLTLTMRSAPPPVLHLNIAHATLPAWDVRLAFSRIARRSDGKTEYSAPCSPLRAGHWRIELSPDDGAWAIRQSVQGMVKQLSATAVAEN